MIVAHSGRWGGKSCAGEGAPQVAVRIAVAAGKKRAGEPEDGLDVRSGFALREQMPGDPQIHDAPVRLWKAFENMPALHTTLVNRGGLLGAEWAKLCGCRVPVETRGRMARWSCTFPDGLQQRLGARRQTQMGVDESHPRSAAARCASRGLLIGEPGEPSQVTPVGAGQVASIDMRQMLACGGRHRRFQRRGAEANPGLQMAGAGLQHHTRVMAVGAHNLHDPWIGAIQIDENIACVLVIGVGQDVHVAALAVTSAQKTNGGRMRQLGRRPKPFSGKRTTCLMVNQTDQVQFVGHRRELTTDGLPSEKNSTVIHDCNFAIEATRRTINFQRTTNSVLTVCLTSGGRFSCYFSPVTRTTASIPEKSPCRSNIVKTLPSSAVTITLPLTSSLFVMSPPRLSLDYWESLKAATPYF